MNTIMCYNLTIKDVTFYLNSKDGLKVTVGGRGSEKLESAKPFPWQVLVDDLGSVEVTARDASVCANPSGSHPRVSKNCQGREQAGFIGAKARKVVSIVTSTG